MKMLVGLTGLRDSSTHIYHFIKLIDKIPTVPIDNLRSLCVFKKNIDNLCERYGITHIRTSSGIVENITT